jgi:hypothetical protein
MKFNLIQPKNLVKLRNYVFKKKYSILSQRAKPIKIQTCENYNLIFINHNNFNNEYRKRIKQKKRIECELCATENLKAYEVLPPKGGLDESILACSTCIDETPGNEDLNHWRCLNDSMWSEHAVQVVSWRMLSRLRSAGWPQN